MRALHSAVLILLTMLACARESPEARVKQAFEACVKGIESSDPGAVIERLDTRFEGPGGMDRNGAKLYLLGILRREKIGVTIFSNRVEVKGHEALQTTELLLTSQGGSGLLPQDASRRTFLLRWVEKDGAWRLRALVDTESRGDEGLG